MRDLLDDAYDEDGDERDDPQERDWDDEDETPTVPCPACRKPVADCADRCPHCGEWVVTGAGDAPRHHPWFLVAVVCMLLAVGAYVLFCR